VALSAKLLGISEFDEAIGRLRGRVPSRTIR